ncbi:MAG: hypothetical protein AAGF11_11325 [Myxococcota bacterium]
MVFEGDIVSTVTDDYTNAGYVNNQGNVAMSAVLGETDYMSTGHNNLNLVVGMPGDPRYCAGCNGSFELSFTTTSVGNAVGVNGVGLFVQAHNMMMPYFAFITFGDGTTANIQMPPANSFWGVAAPERIERIHFGFSMGVSTINGYFEIDDLIVGDGNVAGCVLDSDCFDDGDVCTSPVCIMGQCDFAFNNAPCDDGNLCTENDSCDLGFCGGAPVDCDDGNVCTTDSCDAALGCIIQLNTEPCDDQSICTEMDTCSAGMCMGTAIDCNDGDVCSIDSCDPVMGCMSEPQAGCCDEDEDCGEEEICDLEINACEPIPVGQSSSGGQSSGETGDAGVGSTGEPGADGSSGGATSVGNTGMVDTGTPVGTTGGGGGSQTGDPGEVPEPGFNTCECTTGPTRPTRPTRRGRVVWLLAVLGLLVRRRRSA